MYMILYVVPWEIYTAAPPHLWDVFQDPQWMPDMTDGTKPSIGYVFSVPVPMIKFNL